MDRAGPPRRSAGQRGFRHRSRAESWRSGARGDQRPAPPAHDRGRRAVPRIHLQHPSRRAGARRQALRHLLDGPAGARRRLRHGRRVQRCRSQACARQRARRDYRPARSHPRALRRVGCDSQVAAALALDRGKRTGAARELRLHAAPRIPAGRRLHPECRAHACTGAAAGADRGAEGARLRQPLHRMALPEVGAGHRRDGRRDRARGRRLARPPDHRSLQQILPVSRSCSSACRSPS